MLPTSAYLLTSAALFAIGVCGVMLRRSAVVIFMCIELMLNSVNLTFIAFARQLGQMDGQLFVFFTMTVAAAEAAVGLAIIIALVRHRRTTDVDTANLMRW